MYKVDKNKNKKHEIIGYGIYTPSLKKDDEAQFKRATNMSRIIEASRILNTTLSDANVERLRESISKSSDETQLIFNWFISKLLEAKRLINHVVESYAIV